MIEGTVVHEVIAPRESRKQMLRLGHPGGVMEIGAILQRDGKTWTCREAVLGRTAPRLMEGYVLVPKKYFSKA